MNFFNKFEKLKMKYKDSPNMVISFVLATISILFIFVGGTYALIFDNSYTQSINSITAGTLVMNLENTTPVININNAIPTLDETALNDDNSYQFTVRNNGSIMANYKISLINDCVVGNTYIINDENVTANVCMPTQYIKIAIKKGESEYQIIEPDSQNNIILAFDNLSAEKQSEQYSLKLWLDKDTPNTYNDQTQNVIISLKLQMFSQQSTLSDASGANKPLLTNNMIPVYYDIEASTWKKADSTNLNETYKWYNYDSKMWANAVTTTSTNRQNYIDANPGTPIPMSDINTMWVWIPRYTYTYFNTNTPSEIQINFESGTNSSGTISCTDAITQTCTDTTNGSLVAGASTYTHPAFTFGDQDLTGLWVGKFEVSSDTTCTAADNSSLGSGCNLNTIKPLIKPNVTSWTGAQVSTYFEAMRNMEQGGNIYGFPQASSTTYNTTGVLTNDNNNIDTHMMKNMEWGAVVYLSHSKYGTNKNITINSSSNTGDNNYATNTNQSTTENIYGIYDMNGGTYEYVMGNMVDSSNQFYPSNSATFAPQSKYYNTYAYDSSSSTTYSRGKLGDATIELAPSGNYTWYSNNAYFVNSTNSWFSRGGHYNDSSNAGAFNFSAYEGSAGSLYSSRSTLTLE